MNSPFAETVNQIHQDILSIQQDVPELLQNNHTGTKKQVVQSGERKVEVIEIDRLTKYYLVRDAWRMNIDGQVKELLNLEDAA
jgi:hypothetical protein